MIRLARLSTLRAVVAVGLFLTTGCDRGKGTPVSGKLVFPNDVKLETDDQVSITFVPEDGSKRAATAIVTAADLTFVANSGDTQGVPPGKYKITAQITAYAGAPGSAKRSQVFNDTLNKAYSATASKLTYEVTAGTDHNLTIDLVKGTVTKN